LELSSLLALNGDSVSLAIAAVANARCPGRLTGRGRCWCFRVRGPSRGAHGGVSAKIDWAGLSWLAFLALDFFRLAGEELPYGLGFLLKGERIVHLKERLIRVGATGKEKPCHRGNEMDEYLS
jgi:hypothetical protein